mgnify:FL=1
MKKKSIKSMSMLELIQAAGEELKGCEMKEEKIKVALPTLRQLAKHLDITHEEAMLVVGLFNQGGFYRIDMSDLCKYYNCQPIQMLHYTKLLKSLANKEFLRPKGSNTYDIADMLIEAVEQNKKPEKRNYKDLDAAQWFEMLSQTLYDKNEDDITYERMIHILGELLESNHHLKVVQQLRQIDNNIEGLLPLLISMDLFVQNSDDMIGEHDIEDFYENERFARREAMRIQRGSHEFIQEGWIEPINDDGRANPNFWKLTDKAKKELLSELNLPQPTTVKTGLLESDKITRKQLYFCTDVQKQMDNLRTLLQPERFGRIQERLEKNGMRKGFACIFYGTPGTGKTETVLQLARETGRDIMQVDIPTLRSKWVGDTEKNIKGVFDRYREYCKKSSVAPILLFNEADAVLNKRNEGATDSVDKMENAMQNIILQEMETLDGIMIATTNLTNNLDAAFERRFLYKIEFPKPTPKESQHIWQAMLPTLTDSEALTLAERYAFSGGQIENIARKQLVNSILNEQDDTDLTAIREACDHELLYRKQTQKIGF